MVHDPGFPSDKQERKGQFFVSLKKSLANSLPGTNIKPEIFLSELQINNSIKKILLSDILTVLAKPIIKHKEKHFTLNIFHGSANIHALGMSQLAVIKSKKDASFSSENKRAYYQSHLFKILKPIIQYEKNKGFSLRIIEDCLASGDTISGILAMIKNETKINISTNKIRIDVAVATAQGILILRKFAWENKLDFEVNIGYLAYGLSEGIKIDGVRKHANYIVYPVEMLDQFPKKIKNLRSLGGDYSVVGDMGDASRKLSGRFDNKYPWNKNRDDRPSHGKFNPSSSTIFYFANGGYLMKAYYDYLNNSPMNLNQLVFSAKRIWSTNLGYGVLIYDLDKKLLV
jgi:hypoxanthine-guanine phosphoribosyltransferase